MKHLLPPSLAVLLSTAGTALGCRFVGMPLPEVKLAVALALAVSATAAFGATLLAGRAHRLRRNPTP